MQKCGFFYANPRLERKAEEDYYKKIYIEVDGKDYWYESRIDVFKSSLCKISKFLKIGKLIDIGCGMGYFMDLARSNGWKVKGVEISDYALRYAQTKLGLDVVKGSLEDAQLKTEYFDIATAWNTLDQIYDPKANLIELNRILRKGGYLFIRVSNLYFHLKLFRLYNIFRPLFKKIKINNIEIQPSVFHLYSFDKNSIKRLLELTGFSVVATEIEPIGENIQLIERFGRKKEILRKLFDLGVMIVYFLTLGKIVISPSIFVIAQK